MQFLKCLRVAFEETRKLISCLPLHAPLPLVHLVSKHQTLHRQHYSFIEMPRTSENIGGPFLTIHDNSDIKVSFWKFYLQFHLKMTHLYPFRPVLIKIT